MCASLMACRRQACAAAGPRAALHRWHPLILLLAAALAAFCAPPGARAAAAPVDASVILLFASDVEGGDSSQCAQMARRAMETGGRSVSFVITGYYRSDGGGRMADLGYRESERDRAFKQFTFDAAYRFSSGLARCMRVVVDRGFSLAVHLHLDDGENGGTWRNALDFEPYTKYGALSYWDALVKPAAMGVREANVRKGPLRFAMQAEMGATLFYYARSYKGMVRQIKALISEGGTPPAAVRVGVNVNWEKVCGCPWSLMDSTNYFPDLQARWREVQSGVSLSDVQALFRAVDWVGLSAYAGLPNNPTALDIEESLRRAARELRLFGVDLRGLGKELIYSEYGVGGGETSDYQTPARDWARAAAVPYWGVDGRYDAARDPWARPANRDALRRFFNATLEFAGAGGGPSYKVGAIFLWSIISFDVTGVHYLSYPRGAKPGKGGYRDPVIASAIRAHNANVPRDS